MYLIFLVTHSICSVILFVLLKDKVKKKANIWLYMLLWDISANANN